MIVTRSVGKAISAAVVRVNERNNEPNRLFDQVVEIFETRQQWPSGHTQNVLDGWLRGKRSTLYLRNVQGWIKCHLIVLGKTRYDSPPFVVGYCSPQAGWSLSTNCTLADFNQWQRRTRAQVSDLENRGRL